MPSKNVFKLVHRLMDGAGAIEPGATIAFFAAGSSTPLTVYSDRELTLSAGVFVTADAQGAVPERWVESSKRIKLVYRSSTGTETYTRDYADQSMYDDADLSADEVVAYGTGAQTVFEMYNIGASRPKHLDVIIQGTAPQPWSSYQVAYDPGTFKTTVTFLEAPPALKKIRFRPRVYASNNLTGDISDMMIRAPGSTQPRTAAEWFGDEIYPEAFGFGKAGNTETQDTAALQAAATAAAGKRMRMPPFWRTLVAATGYACITLPTAGITILGYGSDISGFRVGATTGAAIFASVDATNVHIENMGFDGQAASAIAWQYALVNRGVNKLTVKSCWFYRIGSPCNIGTEGFHGTDHIGDGSRRSENIWVTDNLVEECWGSGAFGTKFNGGAYIHFSRNIFRNSCTFAISIESEDNLTSYNYWAELIVVSDNLVSSCSYARSSGGSDVAFGLCITEMARRLVLKGNIVVDTYGNTTASGIELGTSPTQDDETVREIIMSGNLVANTLALAGRGHNYKISCGDASVGTMAIGPNLSYGGRIGVTFETAGGSFTLGDISNVTVTGFVVEDAEEFGFWSQSVSGSGELPMRNVAFANCTATGCGSSGWNLFAINCTFVGCHAKGTGGTGFSMQTGSKQNTFTACHANDNAIHGFGGDFEQGTLLACQGLRNGQTQTSGYGFYATAGNRILTLACRFEDDGRAALAIGSTTTLASHAEFPYYIAGIKRTLAANPVGLSLGAQTIPSGTYGAIAWEVGADGVVDRVTATLNTTGYASAVLAIAGLPAPQADHVRFAWLTVTRAGSGFVCGTTALNDGTTTVAYTSAVQDYGVRFANNGQTVRFNELVGNGLAPVFGAIANHNTATYDAAFNRIAA